MELATGEKVSRFVEKSLGNILPAHDQPGGGREQFAMIKPQMALPADQVERVIELCRRDLISWLTSANWSNKHAEAESHRMPGGRAFRDRSI